MAESARPDGNLSVNGPKIRKERESRGWTREELAERSGVSYKTLRRIETDPCYRCKPLTIEELAKCFGTLSEQLILMPENAAPGMIFSASQVIECNTEIVSSAREILVTTGSRSRDPGYLCAIEDALRSSPHLVYYRVMFRPPFWPEFQEHLLRLLEIRNPKDRSLGFKTFHLGLYEDLVRQHEFFLCANEKRALIVLPSVFRIGEYNTAVVIEEPEAVQGFVRLAKDLYAGSRILESADALLKLGILEEAQIYD